MAYDLQSTHRHYQAALALMAGSGASLRERLLDGYRLHARLAYSQQGKDVPPALHERMAALHVTLTAGGLGPEGSLAKTINAMGPEEVEAAAAELVAIAQAVDRATW